MKSSENTHPRHTKRSSTGSSFVVRRLCWSESALVRRYGRRRRGSTGGKGAGVYDRGILQERRTCPAVDAWSDCSFQTRHG
eukprot:3060325-Rhodomonas_salina.1